MAGYEIIRMQGAGALHSAINICQLIYELIKFCGVVMKRFGSFKILLSIAFLCILIAPCMAIVDFIATPTSGQSPLTVNFTSLTTSPNGCPIGMDVVIAFHDSLSQGFCPPPFPNTLNLIDHQPHAATFSVDGDCWYLVHEDVHTLCPSEMRSYRVVKSNYIHVWGNGPLEILNATMVSPNELGIGVNVTFPENIPKDAARTITFESTINGKFVSKTIDVSDYTTPGVSWGRFPGVQNQMYDSYGRLLPTTPLRINLNDEGVPRFTDNIEFNLSGTASYDGGPTYPSNTTNVSVLLPVVVLHGYVTELETGIIPFQSYIPLATKIGTINLKLVTIKGYPGGNTQAPSSAPINSVTSGILRQLFYDLAYRNLSNNLTENGYSKNKEWGISGSKQYVTLWDPEDKDIGISSLSFATPSDLDADMNRIFSLVQDYSYADKFNIIGHSTGGLVARYWATQHSERINKIITVGTPHEGIARYYEEPFQPAFKNNQDVQLKLLRTTPNGNIENTLGWFIPDEHYWNAVDWSNINPKPKNPEMNPYFSNTFDYGYSPEVKYYLISGLWNEPDIKTLQKRGETSAKNSTPYSAKIELITTKEKKYDYTTYDNWYSFAGYNYRKGDGYVYWESALDNNGPRDENIQRVEIPNIKYSHGEILKNDLVESNITNILIPK
jgi:pimeloyl-ACP methyl ester carboxylesterase